MKVNLQIARGLAALSVFLFHMKGMLAESFPALARLVQFGDLGVPLFFVISGYVITASAQATIANRGSAHQFMKRRFLRIYPPFWCSVAVIVALPFFLEALSMLKTGSYSVPSPRYLALDAWGWLQLLTLTKIFAGGGIGLYREFELVNIVYWTLAIEFQFYLVVYVALLARRHFITVLASATALSLLVLAYPADINGGVFLHFWPMFALGIVLWYLVEHGFVLQGLLSRPVMASMASMAILIPVSAAVVALAYQGTLRTVLDGVFPSEDLGFALVCFLLLWASTPFERTLAAQRVHGGPVGRSLVGTGWFLGEISYSLYLLHTQLLALPAMVGRQVFEVGSPAYLLIIILGTIALCRVFYVYCERPFSSEGRRLPARPCAATS